MRRDYRLYELSESEFEELVVKICVKWLGEGVTPFAPGRDGGRDGKFNGKAECFPSTTQPLEGDVVLQAKHVAVFDKSCSDKDFERLLKKEHAKIKRLGKKGLCDHYMVFTNRRYTGGADEKLIAGLMALGVKSAHIIGIERLNTALDDMQQLREWLPNRKDSRHAGLRRRLQKLDDIRNPRARQQRARGHRQGQGHLRPRRPRRFFVQRLRRRTGSPRFMSRRRIHERRPQAGYALTIDLRHIHPKSMAAARRLPHSGGCLSFRQQEPSSRRLLRKPPLCKTMGPCTRNKRKPRCDTLS
ncbi:bll7213 [Bradyrhizobium diazoefficiens USDA 110]|uniref:Bll7213 protein n=1 Tax=Bradyrhizobium diazoefficiens (strain JCM 10833 / BCRC 13528 / IAM 13628 / NBRC 14792 / USDA 110) TaxID=224911 RepID=Q89E74_BRADU|nr:hypothetical protein Bdiaspc4_38045 [Bradyrhizobium diazoefficiens]BAC52478.1 bll7213 [Bradyrhizobium diazoefficiens USDA 110]